MWLLRPTMIEQKIRQELSWLDWSGVCVYVKSCGLRFVLWRGDRSKWECEKRVTERVLGAAVHPASSKAGWLSLSVTPRLPSLQKSHHKKLSKNNKKCIQNIHIHMFSSLPVLIHTRVASIQTFTLLSFVGFFIAVLFCLCVNLNNKLWTQQQCLLKWI